MFMYINLLIPFILMMSVFTLMPFRDRRAMNCETVNEALDIIKNQVGYELARNSSK